MLGPFFSTREADHGPFAQLAKELIIEELRAREWPAARGDITRRPKYGDFLAWRKVRASAAAAGVVGYLNRAVQTPRDTGAREGNDDRGNGLGGVGSTIGRDEGSVNQHLGGTDARETMTELGNTPEGVRSTVGRDESRANQPSVAPDARKTINERGTAPGGVQSTIRGEENRAVAPNLLAPPEQSNVSAGRVFGQNLAPTGEQNVPGVDGNVTSGRDAAPTDSEALGGVNNSRGLRPNPGPPERVVSEDRARSRVSDQAAVQRNEQSGVGGTQSPGLAQAAIPLERVTNAAVATKASARGAQPGAGQTGEEGQPKLGITESSALALAATPQERETSVYNVGAAIEDGSDRGVPPGADQGAESVRPGRGVGLKAVNESGENPKTGVNGGRQETVAGRGTPYEDKGVIGTGISRSAERTDLPRVQLDKADIQTSVSGDIPEQLWEDDQADGINKKGPVLLSVVKPTKEGGPKPVFETISKAAKAIK